MTGAIRAADRIRAAPALPPELADIMRHELPSLVTEIKTEIRRCIPEYAALHDRRHRRRADLIGVQQSLSAFVERVGSSTVTMAQRDRTLRRFGRYEAYQGRGLDTLEGAFRIGVRLALRRARRVAGRYQLSSGLLLDFADALLGYVDELVDIAREGYLEAQAEMARGQSPQRRLLLRTILSGQAPPRSALLELADRAGWRLPNEVTLVGYGQDRTPDPATVEPDALVDLDGPQPHLLLPGQLDQRRRAGLESARRPIQAAVGVTVPLADAAHSLRWARQTLRLVEVGVLPDAVCTYAEDHLVTLWLCADPPLLDVLARRRLALLNGLTASQRERIVETIRAWLDTRGNAVQMAELLHIHPQTVRYRLRGLDSTLGALLSNPTDRFTFEAVLRASQLRDGAGGDSPSPHQL